LAFTVASKLKHATSISAEFFYGVVTNMKFDLCTQIHKQLSVK